MNTKVRRVLGLFPFGLPVLVAAAVLAGLTVNGIGPAARVMSSPSVQADLNCQQAARDFTDYPLVYPGTDFQGLPLTACQRVRTPANVNTGVPAMDYFVFTYGSCTPREEAGCPAPVEVIVDPPCAPSLSERVKKEKVKIRGQDIDVKMDGSLRIEGQSFKATIYASGGDYESSMQKAEAVVAALRGANDLASDLTLDAGLGVKLKGNRVCR